MPLPVKALRYGQIKLLTVGSAVPTSGHQVCKAEFVDTDGQTKLGFYKELIPDGVGDGSYPEILGKYSVATSVLVRLALGEKGAEDRLVFDDNGRIIGTLSVNLAKYKPMYTVDNLTLPEDPQEREEVAPSVETLLNNDDVAAFLVNGWRIKCDDRHPGNFSLFGSIDWDMAFYPYTYIMKGKRLVDGITKPLPEKGMTLRSKELDNFPIIEGRTHTPTNHIPGNFNLFKKFYAFASFRKLASNPAIKTEEGDVYWQEQFFSAMLKELLTFDPEMVRARLKEYIGEEMTLNFLSLPKEKHEQLTKLYPDLFNEETDKKPFIDHIMKVFQREYDELYRAVVLYPGCIKNSEGVPVISFNRFLNNKPSAFKKIQDWASKLNEKIRIAWDKFQKTIFPHNVRDAFASPADAQYDLQRMTQRYHQIWRDAHSLALKSILNEGYSFIDDLAASLQLNPTLTKEEDDSIEAITESFQLIGKPRQVLASRYVDCDDSNDLKKGLIALENLVTALHSCAQEYYVTPREKLTNDTNQNFCDAITKLIRQADNDVLPRLSGSKWANKYTDCVKNMQQLLLRFQFQYHIHARDEVIHKDIEQDRVLLTAQHTDEKVVNSCLRALFKWVNTLTEKEFNEIVGSIIESYKPSDYNFFANRERGPQVEHFLKKNAQGMSCAQRLAYVLKEGGVETSSLNTNLIKGLMPLMIKKMDSQIDVNLLSVNDALERKKFDAVFYATKAQEYVNKQKEFNLPSKELSLLPRGAENEKLNKAIFDWISVQGTKRINNMIDNAISDYKPRGMKAMCKAYISSAPSREIEIKKYMSKRAKGELSKSGLFATILANGGNELSSFNTALLIRIFTLIKTDLNNKKNEEVQASIKSISNLEMVLDIALTQESCAAYGEKLKPYAQAKIAKNLSLTGVEESSPFNASCM